MQKPFRLAIVGCGQIASQSHLPAALASNRVEMKGLVDPVITRAESLAQQYGLHVRTAADITDLYGEIDGAIVSTPNNTHFEIAMKCIESKVHVLVEKPLATSFEEGDALMRAARSHRITVAVGYYARFEENFALLAELMRTRQLGGVKRFLFQCGSIGGWAPLSGYTLDKRTAGGGVLVVTGSHFLDWMLHTFGYPDECEYADDSIGGPEANVFATFRYRSGTRGAVRLSKTVPLPMRLIIETENGLATLDPQDSCSVLFRPAASGVEQRLRRKGGPKYGRKGAFQAQLEDFVDACRSGADPTASVADGVLSLQLFDELYSKRQCLASDWYPWQTVTVI